MTERLSDEELEQRRDSVASLYSTGLLVREIAEMFGVSIGAIANDMRTRGITGRSHTERFSLTLPEDVLTDAWAQSEPGAWACGLIVTDGHLRLIRPSGPSPTLKITLKREDRDGVVNAAKAFGIPATTVRDHLQSDGEVSTLEFTHDRLWFLVKVLGMPLGDKTETAHMPEMLLGNRHAWRGALDGDGWSSLPKVTGIQQVQLGLCGSSRTLLSQYQAFLEANGVESPIYGENTVPPGRTRPCPSVVVVAEPAAIVADLLYTESTYSIDRKKSKALRVVEARLGKPGRAPRRPRVTPEEIEGWKSRLASGESLSSIVESSSRSYVTVQNYLVKAGLVPEPVKRPTPTGYAEPVTSADVDEWERLVKEDGLNASRIAKKFDRSYGTVQNHLAKRGLVAERSKREEPTPEEIQSWVSLLASGVPVHKVAAESAWSRTVVEKVLRSKKVLADKVSRDLAGEDEVGVWIAMHAEGLTVPQIAKKTNKSANTIYRHLAKRGAVEAPVPQPHPTAEEVKAWAESVASGKSVAQVAKEAGRDPQTVKRRLAKLLEKDV